MSRHYLDILAEVIRDNWDWPALTDYAVVNSGSGNDYTYGGMYRIIEGLVHTMREAGLKSGDHIAICGVNSANWAVSYLAVAALGGVSVTVLNTQMPEAIAAQVQFADCAAAFVDSSIWKSLPGQCVPLVWSLDDFSLLAGDGELKVTPSEARPEGVCFRHGDIDDLAQICFTSGSTSEPKGVMESYRNISNNVAIGVDSMPFGKHLPFVSMLPMAHSFGLFGALLIHLANAHRVYLLGADMSGILLLKAFMTVGTYAVVTVPLVIESLYDRGGDGIRDVFGSQMKQILVGGSSLRRDVEDALLRLGMPLTVGYGTTETTPLIGGNRWQNYKPHSGGRVVSGMEARVSDAGEILVRGENVMLGYYKNPEATRRKIDGEGWLHTGDRGRVDEDGTVYVYGRLEKDIIVLPSGENIIPQNIEALLDRIDGVGESLVLERAGRLVALVYPEAESPGNKLDKSELLRAVNLQLPTFSQLADIEFVSEPFQHTGKSGLKRYLYH